MIEFLDSFILFLHDFFVDKQFLVLLTSTIILFLAIFVMWFFYHKQLVKKDLFKIPKIDSEHAFMRFINRFMYVIKYVFIFPLYSFIWFLIFSFLLVLIAKTRPIDEIMFFGIVIVSVTRIAAYINAQMAEDMAKLLPWAIVILFLTDPKSITLETAQVSLHTFIDTLPRVAKYLVFIALVEWTLRFGNHLINVARKNNKSSGKA